MCVNTPPERIHCVYTKEIEYTHTCTQSLRIHTHVHTRTNTHTHTSQHTNTHTRAHTHANPRAHSHMHTPDKKTRCRGKKRNHVMPLK